MSVDAWENRRKATGSPWAQVAVRLMPVFEFHRTAARHRFLVSKGRKQEPDRPPASEEVCPPHGLDALALHQPSVSFANCSSNFMVCACL